MTDPRLASLRKGLSSIQLDRAIGVLMGTAAGDALGAGYEFGDPLPDDEVVEMRGGGAFHWAPGEWTDDTSMAIPIARLLADGLRFNDPEVFDALVASWADWATGAKDVGIQTRAVLAKVGKDRTEAAAVAAAVAVHNSTGRSGGNGSLMRTGPVALGYLDDPDGLAAAARRISDLTHFDPEAGDSCVLWSLAIRHAILTGELDVRVGLDALPEERREEWSNRFTESELKRPRDFSRNGWVVQALQGAWSAIHGSNGMVDALERAVRGGHDTDTVAAIAGALVGAAGGASSIPARWRRVMHGWPGLRSRDLMTLAVHAVTGGVDDAAGWPRAERFTPSAVDTLVPHPRDEGVWLASLGALNRVPESVEVVVSLCRVGSAQTDREHVEFWLVDRDGSNANLDAVLIDAVDTIAAARAEGKVVLLHCFEARSRTAAVAALYAMRHLGMGHEEATRSLREALPDYAPARFLREAMVRLGNAGKEGDLR